MARKVRQDIESVRVEGREERVGVEDVTEKGRERIKEGRTESRSKPKEGADHHASHRQRATNRNFPTIQGEREMRNEVIEYL